MALVNPLQPEPSPERPMSAAELRLLLTLTVGPMLVVLFGFALGFSFVVFSALFGSSRVPTESTTGGAKREAYLQVLQDYDCVLVEVSNGQAVLYRCELEDGLAYLTPTQVRALASEIPVQEDDLGKV